MSTHELQDAHADSHPQVEAEEAADRQRRFHYFRAPEVGAKVLKAMTADPRVDGDIEEHLTSERQKLIERFPSNMEGIDIERVNNYMDDLGLRRAPVLVLDKEQESEFITEAFGVSGLSSSEFNTAGWYDNDRDLVVVIRDPQAEFFNGPEYTESLIVHELAHGSGRFPEMRVEATPNDAGGHALSVTQRRVGQSVRHATRDGKVGGFLEEAFAEQVRAKYVADVLGKKNGLSRLTERDEDTVSPMTLL